MFWEPSSFVSVAIDDNIHRQHELVFHIQSNATSTNKEQIVWATYVQQMDLASVGIDQNVFILMSIFELQIAHTLENQELNDLWEEKLKYLGYYNYNMVNKTSKQFLITTTTNINECLDAYARCKSIGNDTCDTMNINNENHIHINSTFQALKGLLFLFSFVVVYFFLFLSPVFFIL